MPTPIDWCSRCAAQVYDVDGVDGACGCPEGQLKQLLASVTSKKTIPTGKIEGCFGPVPKVTVPSTVEMPKIGHIHYRTSCTGCGSVETCRCIGSRVDVTVASCYRCQIKQAASPKTDDDFLSDLFAREGSVAPTTADEALQGLWSTEPTMDEDVGVTASVEQTGLEGLWMGRVASETGRHVQSGAELESLWMQELSTPTGTTARVESDDITFDNDMDMDTELSQYRTTPDRRNAFRVDRPPRPTQIGQSGRFPVVREAQDLNEILRPRPVSPRPSSSARSSITEVRQMAASMRPPPPQPVRQQETRSAVQRAAEYSKRTTVFERLMSDDD
jgi:hypothetical protein